MADKPPTIRNIASAPMVYFDNCPTFGVMNGVVELDLAARVMIPDVQGSVKVELTSVAHLRCSVETILNLRAVIDKALAMVGRAIPSAPADTDELMGDGFNQRPAGPLS